MKLTAVDLQSTGSGHTDGHPPGLPTAPAASLPAAAGFAGLISLIGFRAVLPPFDPDTLHALFFVAAPVNIITGYPSVPLQGRTRRLSAGWLARLLGIASLMALNSGIGLTAAALGMAGVYAEARAARRVRRQLNRLVKPYAACQQRALTAGDTVLKPAVLDTGLLLLQRRRWGAARFEAAGAGDVLSPGDTVMKGEAGVTPAIAAAAREMQTQGVVPLAPGHAPTRFQSQLWWWSATVAAVTMVMTRNPMRVMGVLMAGSPAVLDMVQGAAAWGETARCQKRGLMPAHPLAMIAAGEVDTVLLDLPAPTNPPEQPDRWRQLLTRLHTGGYRVGLLCGGAPAAADTLAETLGADFWYAGTAVERAGWAARANTGNHRVAVVGTAPESVPVMAAAHLAVAAAPHPPVVAAAHITATGALDTIYAFLADSRHTGRAEQKVFTFARTAAVAATVATGCGLLAAGSVVTATGLIGLGLVLFRHGLRLSRKN